MSCSSTAVDLVVRGRLINAVVQCKPEPIADKYSLLIITVRSKSIVSSSKRNGNQSIVAFYAEKNPWSSFLIRAS
jgi:hypothetical protein